jgi:hypothetical protein
METIPQNLTPRAELSIVGDFDFRLPKPLENERSK